LAADSEGTTVSFSSCNSVQQQTIGQQLKRIDIAMRCDTLRVYGHVSLVAMSEQSLADMQASGTLRAMGYKISGSTRSSAQGEDGTSLIQWLSLPEGSSLRVVWCDHSLTGDLNIQNCNKLEVLKCPRASSMAGRATGLDRINLSGCPNLRELDVAGNKLRHLDLRPCPKLRRMECNGNELESLNLSASAALEVLTLAREHDFHDVVISLKASDPRVMVIANRLLATRLDELGWDYPIHLGVTEAGDGEDGRVKSAMGIGALLADGIGDTIRVSLTEAPECELPVCRQIVARAQAWYAQPQLHHQPPLGYDPLSPVRRRLNRATSPLMESGGLLACLLPSVEVLTDAHELQSLGFAQGHEGLVASDTAVDLILCAEGNPERLPRTLHGRVAMPCGAGGALWRTLDESTTLLWQDVQALLDANTPPALLRDAAVNLLILSDAGMGLGRIRAAVSRLIEWGIELPILLHKACLAALAKEELPVALSMECGIALLDNLAEGLVLQSSSVPSEALCRLGFSVLQAAGLRRVRADFIACPGCGRTLFDLQDTLARVRSATAHLRHLRIGVMGCIVNGPGEMADADYGYVGAGPGRITLYKGQQMIKRNVPSSQAIDELVALIKENGDWREP